MARPSQEQHQQTRGARIGVKVRVLAAMSLAMTLFLVALLIIVYAYIANAETAADARRIVTSLIPVVIFILVACGFLFFYITNAFVLRPIRKIRDEALAISNGKLDTVISPTYNDEIGDLASSVDQMASALKRDIKGLEEVDKLKSEFISIGSHNLRTPLASIEGGLDILQSESLNDQAKKMLEVIRASANNLITFSEDMLIIANVEARQGNATKRSLVHLDELFAPIVKDITEIATKKGVHFDSQLPEKDLLIEANKELLRLAFRNLLDNACKFTKSGGHVLLSVVEAEEHIIVKVIDTGIGIAASELPNLFTKFHRGSDLLTYDYDGLGIGLYVTKLIFDQHGASISVASEQDTGTTVTVTLVPAS